MVYKRSIINQEKLVKNLIGGVEEVAKSAAAEGPKPKTKTGLIVVITIIIVIVVIAAVIIILFNVKGGPIYERRKRFPELRCGGGNKPDFMDSLVPVFPSLFGPKGMTSAINKAYCDSIILTETNKKNMIPMQKQLNGLNTMIEKMKQQSDNQTKMIYHIRKNAEKQFKEIQQKLYNLYSRVAYLFKVFARLFYKIFTVFRDIFTVLKYTIWTLASLWNGPIGRTLRFLCFGEETLVRVEREGEKIYSKISEVQFYDMIGESNVVGICKFENQKGNQFYNLDGVNVSGSHLVEFEGNLIRVKDHPNSIKIEYENPYIYSLITSNGRMKIGDNLFRDHLGDNTLETYKNFVKPIYDKEILENNERYNDSALNLYPGFTFNSYLKTNKGLKKAEDIEIGETIDGKRIIGIVRYRLEGKTFITPYQIGENSGFLVGLQLYKEKEYKLGDQDERWILGKLDCIGILIEGAVVKVTDEIKVADFDIVSDELREIAEDNIA